MTTGGEQEIRQRLEQALGAVAASPAPVDGAIRQGRSIRMRRWLAGAATGAVAVAAAVAVPVAVHGLTGQSSPTAGHGHPTVTVHPAGPHAPAGLIAWGQVGRRRWGIRVSKPGAPPGGPGSQCVMLPGETDCGPVMAYVGPDPAEFDGGFVGNAGAADYAYGPVGPEVAYLTVHLGWGATLTLHPVRVYGVRAVGFEVPPGAVVSITAYSRHGVIGTAIPFQRPGQDMVLGNWLRPGQVSLPRATGRAGAGDGWSVTVYQGPWGRCLVTTATNFHGSDCLEGAGPLGTSVTGWTGGSPRVVFGSASAAVAHVVVVLSDGSAVRTGVVSVGGQKYFAVAVPRGVRPLRWLAYDSARRGIGSGKA